jgi:hypothetical protein
MMLSNAGSCGEWIRLQPQGSRSPSDSVSVANACSTRAGLRPPAPKKPSIPARAISITSDSEAMPRAMAPVT